MTAPSSIGSKGQRVGLQADACDSGGGSFYPPPDTLGVDLDFAPGDVVAGRHVIQYYLADSPLAALYVARHASVPSLAYVLKVLKREFATIPDVVEQFRVEATSIAQLRDPHSVRITDMGLLPDGRPFICREFCPGIALPRLMERFGPLPVTLVHRIALGVLSSLTEAHDLGVIHRDIRPMGLILTEEIATGDVRCRVLDFGTAHIDTTSQLSNYSRGTNPSIMMCAPQYASPELLRGKVAKSVDTYALGLTLAELLEGKPVVEPGPFLQVAYAQLAESEWELGEKAANSALAGLIRRAIRKNPEERYADAGEMLDDLLRNYPVSYGPYEILWTRWSAIGEGLVVTPRPAIHSAKSLTPRSQTTGDQPAIRLEEAHDVLLNELPTAQRMAAIKDDDALFASIDRISQDSLVRDEVIQRGDVDSADMLLPRSSFFESAEIPDSNAGTQRVRRPIFTQDLPSAEDVDSRNSTDLGSLQELREIDSGSIFSASTQMRLPALTVGENLNLSGEEAYETIEDTDPFSMDDFLEERLESPFAFDDFGDSTPLDAPSHLDHREGLVDSQSLLRASINTPIHVGAVQSGHLAPNILENDREEIAHEDSSPTRKMTAEDAIAALGTPPTDPQALEEFVLAVKKLRRIEAKQNFALMIRGALITVLVVLILWTIANVVS